MADYTLGVAGENRSITAGYPFKFRTDTSGIPSTGAFRFNNSDPTLVTEVVFSALNSDGTDLSDLITSILKPNNLLLVQDNKETDNYALFQVPDVDPVVVDNGDHIIVKVTYSNHRLLLSNNDPCSVTFDLSQIGGGGGSGSGINSVIGGQNILVDATGDPQNPIINLDITTELGGGNWSN